MGKRFRYFKKKIEPISTTNEKHNEILNKVVKMSIF